MPHVFVVSGFHSNSIYVASACRSCPGIHHLNHSDHEYVHCSENVSEQMSWGSKSCTILTTLSFSLRKWFLMMYILNFQTSNNIATNLIMPSCRSEFFLSNDIYFIQFG